MLSLLQLKGLTALVWLFSVHFENDNATPGLALPKERTAGLGCIPEGMNISYQCKITDTSEPPIGLTAWTGSAFQCPATSDRIILQHSLFNELPTVTCGNFKAMAVEVDGTSYVSRLSFTAFIELNGLNLSCSLSGVTEIGSDSLIIGVIPPPPGSLTVNLSTEASLTVSWSPPSGPVEGGVGGYVLGVTGEGCGCVSMNVSSDTTSVTCSEWTAVGQTCSFEIRTISQDCGFFSTSVNGELPLTACEPAELGNNPTSTNGSGTAVTSNGIIKYNGVIVGSTAYLQCVSGYTSEVNSSNRTCMRNGNWSGRLQICVFAQETSSQLDLTAITVPVLAITVTAVLLLICVIYFLRRRREQNNPSHELHFKEGTPALAKLSRPIDAAVHAHLAYFRQFRSRTIYKYNLNSNVWSILPECPVRDTSLAVIPVYNASRLDYTLHTVGGLLEDSLVGNLYCYRQSPEHSSWQRSVFPAMSIERKQVTVIYMQDIIVAAGGWGMQGPVRTVEVLGLNMAQWRMVADLPQPVYRASSLISGYSLYIFGGYVYNRKSQSYVEIKSALKVSLNNLVHSHKYETGVFHTIKPGPILRCTYTAIYDRIYAIGGSVNNPNGADEATSSCLVYKYNQQEDLWEQVDSLKKKRCYCFAVAFTQPKPQLMVVGGYTKKPGECCTNSVEFGQYSGKQWDSNVV